MGKIKIEEFKITTTKDGIKETWELSIIEGDKFIRYNNKSWNLTKTEFITDSE